MRPGAWLGEATWALPAKFLVVICCLHLHRSWECRVRPENWGVELSGTYTVQQMAYGDQSGLTRELVTLISLGSFIVKYSSHLPAACLTRLLQISKMIC